VDITRFRAFQHVKWRPDRPELRRFALAMLVGFAALGCIAALRGHGVGKTTAWLWATGVVLALASQVPLLGRTVYLAVHLPSRMVGFVVSHVLVTLIFLFLFTPLGLVSRLLGRDPLALKPPGRLSRWTTCDQSIDPRGYYRQF
jgi:hypothetical protein